MHDDIAGIDQHPIASPLAFDSGRLAASLLELHVQMIGHGANLTLRAPARDDHEICNAGFSGEFDDDDIFCLIIVKRGFHSFDQTPTMREPWILCVGLFGLALFGYGFSPPFLFCRHASGKDHRHGF